MKTRVLFFSDAFLIDGFHFSIAGPIQNSLASDSEMTDFLVVDDSEFELAYFKQLFGKLGKHVRWYAEFALSAELALDRLQEREFDIILTDLNMPDINGMELLDKVHLLDINIPVIIMTSQGSEESAQQAIRNGAVDYVIKKRLAMDLPEIVRKLNSTVNRNEKVRMY